MAFAKIKVTEIKAVSEFSDAKSTSDLYTALTENVTDSGVYGGYLDMTERDDKYLIVVNNSSSSTSASITLKAGNGFQASVDLTESIPANSKKAIAIESGRFKWMNANGGYIDKDKSIAHGVEGLDEKGKVFFTSNKNTVYVAVFRKVV